MVTKKSTKTAKTKTQKPTKSAAKPATKKSVAKKTATVHATEPFHHCFGLVLIIVGIILVLTLLVGLICDLSKRRLSDAEVFSSEYTQVDAENVFVYASGKEAIEILEEGTGVVFLGFPSCPWCQAYAPMLNDLAKEYGIEKIYYHNTYDDWQNDTDEYKKLTELLSDYLQYDNVGNRHLYVPDVAFVIDGEIVGNDWETSKDTLDAETPEDYWTEERVSAWKERVKPYFERLVAASK